MECQCTPGFVLGNRALDGLGQLNAAGVLVVVVLKFNICGFAVFDLHSCCRIRSGRGLAVVDLVGDGDIVAVDILVGLDDGIFTDAGIFDDQCICLCFFIEVKIALKCKLDFFIRKFSVLAEPLFNFFSVLGNSGLHFEGQQSGCFLRCDIALDGLGQLQAARFLFVLIYKFDSCGRVLGDRSGVSRHRVFLDEVVSFDRCVGLIDGVLTGRDIFKCLRVSLSAVSCCKSAFLNGQDDLAFAECAVSVQPSGDLIAVVHDLCDHFKLQSTVGFFFSHISADTLGDHKASGLVCIVVLEFDPGGLFIDNFSGGSIAGACLSLGHVFAVAHTVLDGISLSIDILCGLSHGVFSKVDVFQLQDILVGTFVVGKILQGQDSFLCIVRESSVSFEILRYRSCSFCDLG